MAVAQFSVPEIRFDSVADPLKFPDNIHLGEAAGVATNSKGDIFVYTRTGHPTISLGTPRPFAHGGSRLFEFDRTGKFVREIGQDSYGFLVAQQVRVDPQDNIWIVDQMSSMVIKFDPNGRVQLLLGRKSESERVPALPLAPPPCRKQGAGDGAALLPRLRRQGGAAGDPGAGAQSDLFQRPTDVAWDAAGNIYVADGFGNARVAKFDKNGKFIKSWGSRGAEPGQFNTVARDRDRCAGQRLRRRRREQENSGLRRRRNLQDADRQCGNSRGDLHHAGTASVSLQLQFESAGRYRRRTARSTSWSWTGKSSGKFGKAGKLPKEFGTVNAIDCRSENELYVGELGNWRVQKLTLHPN